MEDQERINIKSDSAYGSNKSNSNSQSQKSSGSSKSGQSSLSSSGSHKNAYQLQSTSYSNPEPPYQNPNSQQALKRKKQRRSSKCSSPIHSEISSPTLQQQKQHLFASSQEQKNMCAPNSETQLNAGNVQNISPQPSSPSKNLPIGFCLNLKENERKSTQMTALSRVLSCIRKYTESSTEFVNDENINPSSTISKWQEYFEEHMQEETGATSIKDGFATAVSMEDGVVVHMTPNITEVLGFPKDMWIGRSFIDFVHPKDRIAFASHITCGLSFPIEKNENQQNKSQGKSVNSEPFFCRMRQYRGLKSSGFGVVDKPIIYFPFKLTMKLKEIDLSKCENENNEENKGEASFLIPVVHLVILATIIKSAFQFPEEVISNPENFITRHSATCNFGHFDTDAISYLGHLPQDLIGNSILDFYHPDDMKLLKSIYEGVMMEQGKPFRSKPYRFRAFNGTFATMETDWSCFINPWSWKLEFVIGQHRVVKGPLNPNVFDQPREEDILKVSEEVLSNCKATQEEIKKLLAQTVSRRLSDPLRQQSSRRRKDLAALVDTLLEQIPARAESVKSGSQGSGSRTFSFLEKDSVMLGEISPYHEDHSESNESLETPPSYSQLNFKENIERFFQSQPKTEHSEESDKMEASRSSTDEENKLSPSCIDYSSGSNYGQWSGSSGSGSGENESNEMLTEDLLSRHNDKMEKIMTLRHREHRVKSRPNLSHSALLKEARSRQIDKMNPSHGIKRATSPGFSYDYEKAVKIPHLEIKHRVNEINMSRNPISLWPPFSINISPHGVSSPSITRVQTRAAPYFTTKPLLVAPPRVEPPKLPRQMLMASPNQNDSFVSGRVNYKALPASPSFPLYSAHNRENNALFYPQQQEEIINPITITSPPTSFSQLQHQNINEFSSPLMTRDRAIINSSSYLTIGNRITKGALTKIHPLATSSHNALAANTILRKTFEKPSQFQDSCSSINSFLKGGMSDESMSMSFGSSVTQESVDEGHTQRFPVSHFSNIKLYEKREEEEKRPKSQNEEVKLTPEIIFRFQLPAYEMEEVLAKDFKSLQLLGKQSLAVNNQLELLYAEFDPETSRINILLEEEGTTSSGNESSSQEFTHSDRLETKKDLKSRFDKEKNTNQRRINYGRLNVVYEENAPLPPPHMKSKV